MVDVVWTGWVFTTVIWPAIVIIKKTLFRPHDVTYLLGDCLKAKNLLGWKPKNNLKKLIDKMIKFENEQ